MSYICLELLSSIQYNQKERLDGRFKVIKHNLRRKKFHPENQDSLLEAVLRIESRQEPPVKFGRNTISLS